MLIPSFFPGFTSYCFTEMRQRKKITMIRVFISISLVHSEHFFCYSSFTSSDVERMSTDEERERWKNNMKNFFYSFFDHAWLDLSFSTSYHLLGLFVLVFFCALSLDFFFQADFYHISNGESSFMAKMSRDRVNYDCWLDGVVDGKFMRELLSHCQ